MSRVISTEIIEDPKFKNSSLLELTFGKERQFAHDPTLCNSCNSAKIVDEEFKLCGDCYESRREALVNRIKFYVVCDKITAEITNLNITANRIIKYELDKKSLR